MKAQIQAYLRNFTYKPNCTFRTFERNLGVDIILDAQVPDVADPAKIIPVQIYRHIDPWLYAQMLDTKSLVRKTVRAMVREFELHEMNEWLKYKGVCVVNPHPENKR